MRRPAVGLCLAVLWSGLVVASPARSAVPSGMFAQPANYPIPGPGSSMVVADFNHDFNPDIAVMDGVVSILIGKGNGTFKPAAGNYVLPTSPSQSGAPQPYTATRATAADLNGDGKLDLAVIGTYPGLYAYPIGDICVLLGNGNGTFQVMPTCSGTGNYGAVDIAATDLDGDGATDVVVANHGAIASHFIYLGNLAVLLGHGDGTFEAPVTYPAHYHAGSVAVGDLNHDGKPDAVLFNTFTAESGDGIQVYLGNGDGTLAKPPTEYAVGDIAGTLADVNGDGELDAVGSAYDRVIALRGAGDGTFGPKTQSALVLDEYSGDPPTMADVTGDGVLDAITLGYDPALVSIQAGLGDGTFCRTTTVPALAEPISVVAADFDGDDSIDLAVTDEGSNDVTILLNDPTAPRVSACHSFDGYYGWNITTPVTETITASDPSSPIDGAPSCTLDGQPAALVPGAEGTWTFQVTGEGEHSVSCAASNTQGREASATDTVNIDTVPPDTAITRHPARVTHHQYASFKFQSSETWPKWFDCTLDRQPRPSTACYSPESFPVDPGRHVLFVRAVDGHGNVDPTPAVWRWRYVPRH